MINIIYWTLSGNTQMMAEAIGEGVKESGKEVNKNQLGQKNQIKLESIVILILINMIELIL